MASPTIAWIFWRGPLLILLASGCVRAPHESASLQTVVLQDRNGFSETVCAPERLARLEKVDFLQQQPYEKVIRVFARTPQGAAHSELTTYHPNGHLHQRLQVVNGRAHGLYEEFFPNGRRKVQARVVGGTADLTEAAMSTWLFDGECWVWRKDGSREARLVYEGGLLHGLEQRFSPQGTVVATQPYQRGRLHGTAQAFDADGTLMGEERYHQGIPEGRWWRRWPSGEKAAEEVWKEGKLTEGAYWTAHGQPIGGVRGGGGRRPSWRGLQLYLLEEVLSGELEGSIEELDSRGRLVRRWHRHQQKKEGIEEVFHPESGKKRLEVSWSGDKISGPVRSFYPSGRPESLRQLVDNKRHGQSVAWYPCGQTMLLEEYEWDLLVRGEYYSKGSATPTSTVQNGTGTVSLFQADGAPLRSFSVVNGEPVP